MVTTTRPAYKLQLSESFWYHVWCVITFGGYYAMKLTIKKAILEADAAKRQEAQS